MVASVTSSKGAESTTRCSKRSRNSCKTFSMVGEESKSAGLGGWGPAGSTQRLGTASNWRRTSSRLCAPERKLLSPAPFSERASALEIPGRRMSASTITTGTPRWASPKARLSEVEVLPSPG